jgi:hypothetical protein
LPHQAVSRDRTLEMSDPSAQSGSGARPSGAAAPEVFIISYPKSGRTWLRALLGKYLSLKYGLPEGSMLETDRLTQAARLPVTVFTHDGSEMLRGARYENVADGKARYQGKKVVFLARNVKDTLVSAYFQAVKRINVFAGPISQFIRNERFGVKKIAAFYNSWYCNRHVPGAFLLVRYEEMHRDPAGVLTRLLEFMGERDVRADLVEASVAYCSFDNLRQAEREDRFRTSILRPGSVADPDSFKLREGKIGGHVRHLSRGDIDYIDEEMRRFGLVEEEISESSTETEAGETRADER